MWKVVIVLCLTLVALATSETQKTLCKHNDECAADECCYYHEGPLLLSKRQDLIMPEIHQEIQGGWCEKYKKEGDHCDSINKMNGHCECGPGLTCTFIAATLPTAQLPPIVRRAIPPWYGHSECKVDQLTVS